MGGVWVTRAVPSPSFCADSASGFCAARARGARAPLQKIASLAAAKVDYDQPGCGKYFCVACNKHHIDKQALSQHFKSKPHRRRIKQLRDEPYSQEEANQGQQRPTAHRPQLHTTHGAAQVPRAHTPRRKGN